MGQSTRALAHHPPLLEKFGYLAVALFVFVLIGVPLMLVILILL